MSAFVPKLQKTADDGALLRLVVDGHLAWFVERPADREAQAHPLGAFITQEAAMAFAEHHHPGGEWEVSED